MQDKSIIYIPDVMLVLEPPPLSGYLHGQPVVLNLLAGHGSVHCRPPEEIKTKNKTKTTHTLKMKSYCA